MKKKALEPRWYDTWIGEAAAFAVLGLLVTGLRWLVDGSNAGGPSGWSMLSTFVGTTLVAMIIAIRRRVAEIELHVREHNRELAAGAEVDNLLMQLQARLREVQAHRSDVFKGDYVGKCRSALTQGAASAGGWGTYEGSGRG